jgi:ribosomal-protein-alanine N-acetyltransferase
MIPRLQTGSLTLREWRESDRIPFARINTDPEVMRYFPAPLRRAESDRLIERIEAHFAEHGYGLWAVELTPVRPGDPAVFLGFIGLAHATFPAHFTPAIEIGWRLDGRYHGRGYATAGARRVLNFAFDELNLEEVVSFTSVHNLASRRVMEKLGMAHDPQDDFDHPALPSDHRLRRHVLYRIRREFFSVDSP